MNVFKKYLLCVFLLVACNLSAQTLEEEFAIHLKSIDSTYFRGGTADGKRTFNANRELVDYTISKLLKSPTDKYFIANRNLLRKLNPVTLGKSGVRISDTLSDGTRLEFFLAIKPFIAKNHVITEDKENRWITGIDGQDPYGAEYVLPSDEIDTMSIWLNDVALQIPKESYTNFFDLHMEKASSFLRPVEVYESLSGKYIYVYFYGGNAASTYFAKLVFDRSGFVTRIIADYYALSIHSSFRDSFIGF